MPPIQAQRSLLLALLVAVAPAAALADETPAAKISFYKQVRPILQAQCQGCHQPAKAGGEYVLTDFARLLKGGETGDAGVVPGKPDESTLVKAITPADGKAYMPKDKAPLNPAEIELIRNWVAQGAADDTPAGAKQRYDVDHPPVYTRPPVITSIDVAPDGQLLAVAGFHEVLLVKADGSGLAGRLVGVAERIESVRFSPDGMRLAVTGGLPGRMGEVQVWSVPRKELLLSAPVTYDTVYGGSWSPDGKLISFGCADNSVRAINAETGEQVLYQGAHDDWIRDTVFSTDGSHLVSIGRDQTVKLTEVATQRFVDNITSITPGALKGGLTAIARHPKFDHVVVGGSDGTPKVFRLYRTGSRQIGDDANLIMDLFPMTGRVFGVQFSADGKRIVAGSSLDAHGEILVCTYEYDADLPENIKNIMAKVPGARSPEERKALEDHKAAGVKVLTKIPVPQAAVYAVDFTPDGSRVVAAGSDGVVRLFDAASGAPVQEFSPAPLSEAAPPMAVALGTAAAGTTQDTVQPESLPPGASVVSLQVVPAQVALASRYDYTQLLVSAVLNTGDTVDVTRMVQPQLSADVAQISPSGVVSAKADGQGILTLALGGQSVQVPVAVSGVAADYQADFIRDVNPILSRVGCNQGTCHGSQKGKNGFKLSLRGYDPIFDVRALTDDLASRRVNIASPDDSLMLLKSTGAVPHEGGQVIKPDSPYYAVVRNWIAGGAKLDLGVPRVTKIDVMPMNPVVQSIGAKQQIRIVATYADGRTRDVTREAFVESGNTEAAVTNRFALATALRRGEAPMLARYEGAYAATTLTVMGDRTGFVWQQPETWGPIDELVAKKWQRMKIQPSGLSSDAEFLRRAYLDLTGLPPTAEQVRAFLADTRDTRAKRDELIDRLVGSEEYVDYWTNKWADLLQVNRKFLAPEGAAAFRQWIRSEVAANTPYDQFARKILTATGSNKDNPAASYFKILREPDLMMENTTHLFLAVRFNCNKCHDHPFERWTQDQYYQTAAYFAQVGLDRDPASGDRNIGGTAVEGAKPLYEVVVDRGSGDVKHERTGQVAPPRFPYTASATMPDTAPRREQLATWITAPDNQYFARSYVNRLWGYLLGVGIMEPIDDIRAGNPPTNPELLDHLTQEFVRSGFDVRHVVRLICKSRTYQLSVESNEWNADDRTNYSHAIARRLPAEVLLDTIYRVTGTTLNIPGVPAGTRAAALPDSGVELPSGFLDKLGRPVRESACECERSSGLQLGPVMALISGPAVGDAISAADNALAKLVAAEPDDRKVIEELFLRILNRPAQEQEVAAGLQAIQMVESGHKQLVAAMEQRAAEIATLRAQQEKEREEAVAKARQELTAWQQELVPILAERERQRTELIAQRDADLKAYEATLPAKLAEWEKQQASAAQWVTLDPTTLSASTGATLTKQPDGSIIAEAKDGPALYTFTAETNLAGITGVRLEAIADEKLPGRGPGLAPNGNFVVTEFELKAAPKSNPGDLKKVVLENGLADFSQQGYDVKTAADGKLDNANNGWAISGGIGQSHWATFEAKEPVGSEGGTVLTFTLDHRYADNKHNLGRFRISVIAAPKPIGLSLSGDVTALLAVASEARTEEQKAALLKFYGERDEELKKKRQLLAEAQQPVPKDAKLQQLEDKLAAVSRPIPEDPKLVRLRSDVQTSEQQLANRRLTAAQDVAWALINSPEFLFNH